MVERAFLGGGLLAVIILTLVVGRRLFGLWQKGGARTLARLVERGPAIVYFTTPDCFVCRVAQEPELERVRRHRPDISIIKVDASQRRDLARGFRILTVPTTLVVNARGELVTINNGLAEADQLVEQLGHP